MECELCFENFNRVERLPKIIQKCGHTFCKECIQEVVNRQHKCPVCNQALQGDQDLTRNFSFGEMLKNLIIERDAEKQRWIEKLVNQGAQPQPLVGGVGGDGDEQSKQQEINLGPIQTVFTLNLKDSLMAYQEFYDSMQREKRDLRQRVKSKFNIRVMEL